MAALTRRPGGAMPLAENDIYTVLLVIAMVFVMIATVCLAYQFVTFYGLENLFRSSSSPG